MVDSVEVSASESASAEGTPSDESIVVLGVETLVLDLIFGAHEHAVLVLASDWLVKVQSFASGEGLEDSRGVPVAGRPVEGLPSLDDFVESSTDLLDGGRGVG